jgi:hypothetical protein
VTLVATQEIQEAIQEDIRNILHTTVIVVHQEVAIVVHQNQDQDHQVTAETVIVIMVLKWTIAITNKYFKRIKV